MAWEQEAGAVLRWADENRDHDPLAKMYFFLCVALSAGEEMESKYPRLSLRHVLDQMTILDRAIKRRIRKSK